jgi:hypothetical protein
VITLRIQSATLQVIQYCWKQITASELLFLAILRVDASIGAFYRALFMIVGITVTLRGRGRD